MSAFKNEELSAAGISLRRKVASEANKKHREHPKAKLEHIYLDCDDGHWVKYAYINVSGEWKYGKWQINKFWKETKEVKDNTDS